MPTDTWLMVSAILTKDIKWKTLEVGVTGNTEVITQHHCFLSAVYHYLRYHHYCYYYYYHYLGQCQKVKYLLVYCVCNAPPCVWKICTGFYQSDEIDDASYWTANRPVAYVVRTITDTPEHSLLSKWIKWLAK